MTAFQLFGESENTPCQVKLTVFFFIVMLSHLGYHLHRLTSSPYWNHRCIIYFIFFYFQNTIEGRIAYFPVVGRLDCQSTADDHYGFWQLDGYGIVGVYKSDWIRFGGE